MGDLARESGERNRFGIAGTRITVTDTQYPTIQIVAGSNGCWFFMDQNHTWVTTPGQLSTVWRTYDNLGAAPAIAAPTSGVLTPTVHRFDAAKALSSVVTCGGSTANINAGSVLPGYGQRDATVAAPGFLHLGAEYLRPSQWLAPGVAFRLASAATSEAANRLDWMIQVWLEEPTGGPR